MSSPKMGYCPLFREANREKSCTGVQAAAPDSTPTSSWLQFPLYLPLLRSFPGVGAVGFLPTCSLGIAFRSPQPPSDPSHCSRIKTHFDHRDLSLPSDNRNCCFQTTQLPNWIHCPQALLSPGARPQQHTELTAQPPAFTPSQTHASVPSDTLPTHTQRFTWVQLFPYGLTGPGLTNTCSHQVHVGYCCH